MPTSSSTQRDVILVVDDHPTALAMLKAVLSSQPYEIHTASSGAEGLEKAKALRPSIILLDIMMPDMDGFEVCAKLKASTATRDSAIIFLSGIEDSEVKVKGFNVGAVDYINKPFSGPEVIARVQTHLRTRLLEKRLAKRNDQLEAQNQRILASINEGIVGVNSQGRVNVVNNAAEQLTGWGNQSLVDRSIEELFDDTDPTLAQAFINPEEGFTWDCIEMRKKNGETFPASISCTPAPLISETSGAVVVFRDISAQLAQEDALADAAEELKSQRERLAHIERLSTMGEMAAGFAHEVNQPLTAIANYSRVAVRFAEKMTPKPEKLIEIMNKMESQSIRASEVIQRLRNFVKRPVDGRHVLNPNDLIIEIVQLAEVDARNNGVQIHMQLDTKDDLVFVDPIQIQQVALNLIRNGLEAMADTPRKNEGLWVLSRVEQNCVLVEVIDQGIGLEEGAEDELFNPFYTTKPNGMGIGLSVCMTIIKDHGGEIGFRRNENDGTTFWFRLPISEEAD